jgi:hypothetical protein
VTDSSPTLSYTRDYYWRVTSQAHDHSDSERGGRVGADEGGGDGRDGETGAHDLEAVGGDVEQEGLRLVQDCQGIRLGELRGCWRYTPKAF